MHLIYRNLLLIFLSFNVLNSQAQNFDVDLLKQINKNETNFKDDYLKFCTRSSKIADIALPISVFAIGYKKHDKKMQQDAMYMGGAYLGTFAITQITKRIVNRNRPFEDYSFIVKRDNQSGGRSFPSGHTSGIFCTATTLSLYFPKWYVIAPAYLYAASVAWGRMYEGVHYPTDVLAGAIVGSGTAYLSYKIQQWHDRKIEKKNKTTHQKIRL
jgi:membrane-associated phospholipid phosphatase